MSLSFCEVNAYLVFIMNSKPSFDMNFTYMASHPSVPPYALFSAYNSVPLSHHDFQNEYCLLLNVILIEQTYFLSFCHNT
jgi:hypothetical protein